MRGTTHKNRKGTRNRCGFLFHFFDRPPTVAAGGIFAIVHPYQKTIRKFVQNYLLTFSRICAIINTESEGTTMIGIKRTEYTVLNDEQGQAFKKNFIKKHDVASVEENEKLIIITTGETFELNDYLWI